MIFDYFQCLKGGGNFLSRPLVLGLIQASVSLKRSGRKSAYFFAPGVRALLETQFELEMIGSIVGIRYDALFELESGVFHELSFLVLPDVEVTIDVVQGRLTDADWFGWVEDGESALPRQVGPLVC